MSTCHTEQQEVAQAQGERFTKFYTLPDRNYTTQRDGRTDSGGDYGANRSWAWFRGEPAMKCNMAQEASARKDMCVRPLFVPYLYPSRCRFVCVWVLAQE